MALLYFTFCNPLFATLSFIFVLLCGIVCFLNLSLLKKLMSQKPIRTTIIFILALLICVFSNSNFYRFVGCDDIRTMPTGTYCYRLDLKDTMQNRNPQLYGKITIQNGFSDGGIYIQEADKTIKLCEVYNAKLNIVEEYSGFENFSLDSIFTLKFNDYGWDYSFTNTQVHYFDGPFELTNSTPPHFTWLLIIEICVLVISYIITSISVHRDKKQKRIQQK